MVSYESLLEETGGFRFYQLFMLVYYELAILLAASNTGMMIYGRMPPPDYVINASSCDLANSTTLKQVCSFSAWRGHVPFYSVVMEWNLVGSLSYLAATMISLQMAGMLVGPLVIGPISDRFGRKPSFIMSASWLAIFGFSSAFSPTWKIFTGLRFLIGFGVGSVTAVSSVYIQEHLLPRHRLIYQIGGWPIGYIFGALIAKGTKDWKTMSMAIQTPIIPLLVLSFISMESPKWLLERRSVDQSRHVFRQIAKLNRFKRFQTKLFDDLMDGIREEKQATLIGKKQTYTYLDIFYAKSAILPILVLFYSWIATACIYFGILFNLGDLSGDPMLNTVIVMIVRAAFQSSLYFLERWSKRLGRRVFLQIGQLGTAAGLAYTMIAHATGLSDKAPISVTVAAIAGISFCGFLWTVVQVAGVEMFPTEIRNMGFSVCVSIARIGAMAAPQIFLLYTIWRPAPFIILLALMAVWWILVYFFLPETRGKPLPDMPVKKQDEDMELTLKTGL